MTLLHKTQVDSNLFQQMTTTPATTATHSSNLVSTIEQQPGKHLALFSFVDPNLWILNTGATNHITHSIKSFSSYHQITPINVTLPNSFKISAKITGTIQLTEDMVLEDVLFIPEFAFDLFFVTKLISCDNFCLVFQSHACFIHDLTHWRTIGIVSQKWTLHHYSLWFSQHPCCQ